MRAKLGLVLLAAAAGLAGWVVVGGTVSEDSAKLSPEPAAKVASDVTEKSETTKESDYQRTVARLERDIDVGIRRARAQPESWMRQSNLAATYLDHARLTGSHDSYGGAVQAVDAAFARAQEGKGPFLMRAAVHASLHRFAEAAEDAARVLPNSMQPKSALAEAQSLVADVDFQNGNYAEAVRVYEKAVELHRSVGTLSRLAFARVKLGDLDAGDELYVEALGLLAADERRTRSWLQLQRAVIDLESGHYDQAMQHLHDADESFSGWWLVGEHIAEVTALQGREEEAIERYRGIVADTGKPEFMDALSDLLESRDPNEAADLRKRAGEAYEESLERFPESAYGHALDHYLGMGDAERALELALANHELRPGAEAKILLAQAYALADRWDEARKEIDLALDTPLQIADLFGTASVIYAKGGEAASAETLRERAIAMRADIMDELGDLAGPTPEL